MLTADEATETLRQQNYGLYQENSFGSTVREFTAYKNLPKPEFKLETPLLEVVDKAKKL